MAASFAEEPGAGELPLLAASERADAGDARPAAAVCRSGGECWRAWGMNIVTADAFSNRAGVVVDSFRFTDEFRTLEMNES